MEQRGTGFDFVRAVNDPTKRVTRSVDGWQMDVHWASITDPHDPQGVHYCVASHGAQPWLECRAHPEGLMVWREWSLRPT